MVPPSLCKSRTQYQSGVSRFDLDVFDQHEQPTAMFSRPMGDSPVNGIMDNECLPTIKKNNFVAEVGIEAMAFFDKPIELGQATSHAPTSLTLKKRTSHRSSGQGSAFDYQRCDSVEEEIDLRAFGSKSNFYPPGALDNGRMAHNAI